MSGTVINGELIVDESVCIGCNWCVPMCPTGAIKIDRRTLTVDGWVGETKLRPIVTPENCILVGACTTVCITNALSMVGTSQPGGNGGSNGGNNGGSTGGNTGGNNQETPCQAAQQPASNATQLSNNSTYINNLSNIKGFNDGIEHGVILGSVNGSVVSTDIQHGSASSLSLSHSFENPIAGIHSHAHNTTFSPGDVYNLITNNINYSTFKTNYLITPNGTVYALVVTNATVMNNFYNNYPPYQAQAGVSPNFPGQMFDDWDGFTFNNLGNSEMALAYVLDKYNSGLALTKMDSNGNFNKVNPVKNSNGTYSQSNCQ